MKIAVVGCTGKLGSIIMKKLLDREDATLECAVARKGNPYAGQKVSSVIGGSCQLVIADDISDAVECDIFIDCTNAATFIHNSLPKYIEAHKPIVIATTAFTAEDMKKIEEVSKQIPVFMSGNFSIALHDFIETLKFAVKRVSEDTDIQILEYHHNQKMDAPSGTALMIRDALIAANTRYTSDSINICSVRGGNIFGEHEVIFANGKDEVTSFRHQVSSRDAFAEGAIEIAKWLVTKKNGFYGMDDFCDREILQIREMRPEDIPTCVQVIRDSFMTVAREFGITAGNAPRFTAFATDDNRLRWQFEQEHRPMYVCCMNDKIVGYYSLDISEAEECELNNLCVLPDYRHHAIGEQLLQDCFDRAGKLGCRKVNIGIVEENQVLRDWYEKHGFVHMGTKKFDFFPFTCGYMEKNI